MLEVIESPVKLKKCPFCKVNGKLFKSSVTYANRILYHGNFNYSVGCNNPKCKVHPRTKELDDVFISKDKAIETVVAYWNER